MSIVGTCTVCAADIQCTLLKEPGKDVDVKFDCRVRNICAELHRTTNRRRQLKGKLRDHVTEMMITQGKDAITVRREHGARLKDFGDPNPPILPSSEV